MLRRATPLRRAVAVIGLLIVGGGGSFGRGSDAASRQAALPPVAAPTMQAQDAWAFLAQGVCADPKQPPFPDTCRPVRLQTEADPVYWRKHDWPNEDGNPPQGWQASDSVIATRNGSNFSSQPSDFGAPMHDDAGGADAYYRFDPGNDGGDAAIVVGDTATGIFTQDGGTPGIQWFFGPACAAGTPEKRISWALFRLDAGPGWSYAVTQLNGSAAPTRCPASYNWAVAAYRTVAPAFPFRWQGQTRLVSVPAIQSDHYALPRPPDPGQSPAQMIKASTMMERLFYADGFGKIRWEAWLADPKAAKRAADLTASGRCPDLPQSAAPAAGWYRVDCRHWANLTAEPGNWHVADFGWPPADLAP